MKYRILFILLVLCPYLAIGQIEVPISYNEYLQKVCENNLSYAAEKLNIPLAEANILASSLFNDPSIDVEYAYNDDNNLQMGQGVAIGLSKTFSPGKRKARIDLAKSEKALSEALLEDYLRLLRYESATLYVEAEKQCKLYELAKDSYKQISSLSEADSIRFAHGEITEIDAIQTHIEANIIYNEMLNAKVEMENICTILTAQTGNLKNSSVLIPSENISLNEFSFELDHAIQYALDNRTDLEAALKNSEVAQKALSLTRKERGMDFDLNLGYNYNTEVRNEIAPAPEFNGVSLGVSIPLKFSNLNKGEIISAQHQAEQADILYRQAHLEIQAEVIQAYNAYRAALSQVNRLNEKVIEKSRMVLEGKMFSYSRGECSLLEVLDARRTFNEIQTLYIETRSNKDKALIQINSCVGTL